MDTLLQECGFDRAAFCPNVVSTTASENIPGWFQFVFCACHVISFSPDLLIAAHPSPVWQRFLTCRHIVHMCLKTKFFAPRTQSLAGSSALLWKHMARCC